ncbi:NERD domain-containing protein [Virgibacillus oceani]
METLAQLIKLQDYISRYEWDAYRYPSQYIRLKKDQWEKLHHLWENPEKEPEKREEESEQESALTRIKSVFKRNKESPFPLEEMESEEKLPETEQELKQHFLDKLLHFQLKWATSTVTDASFMDKTYYTDPVLKYFLQRFPDTYLIMFYPIFSIKNAPVDGEIIMISPLGVEIIYLAEAEEEATIMAGDERTWLIETEKEQRKLLNPLISLKRTEKIIRSIFHAEKHDFDIQKTILSRVNPIVFAQEPYQTKIVGKQQYEKWFQEKRQLDSPLKSNQLKASEALLKFCQTTSVKRPEWEEDTDDFRFTEKE